MSEEAQKKTTYHLYTYYASSCAARVRIALNLKGIEYVPHYLDMGKDDHESPAYTALNPSASIPTLVIEREGEDDIQICQSAAILDYLDSLHPTPTPLLLLPPPTSPLHRARTLELASIITTDVFPPSNSRIALQFRAHATREQTHAFVRGVIARGFTAYEALLGKYFDGERYSAGGEVSLADVVLVPQVEMARMYGVELGEWPRLEGVVRRLEELEAFKRAHWRCQGDTPEKDRVGSNE